MGIFAAFRDDPVDLVAVEAAGEGLATGRHAAAIAGGRVGVLHGQKSYLLQDDDGQVAEAHCVSAGLDYPGVGPEVARWLAKQGQGADALRHGRGGPGGVPPAGPDRGHPPRPGERPRPGEGGGGGEGTCRRTAWWWSTSRAGATRTWPRSWGPGTKEVPREPARGVAARGPLPGPEGAGSLLHRGVPRPGDLRAAPARGRASGADAVEVGIPFSDPSADGPVIQKASECALAGGATVRTILEDVARARGEGPRCPWCS